MPSRRASMQRLQERSCEEAKENAGLAELIRERLETPDDQLLTVEEVAASVGRRLSVEELIEQIGMADFADELRRQAE